jgi:hypothetical protein
MVGRQVQRANNKIKERNTQKGVASTVTNVVLFLELDEKSQFRCLFSALHFLLSPDDDDEVFYARGPMVQRALLLILHNKF